MCLSELSDRMDGSANFEEVMGGKMRGREIVSDIQANLLVTAIGLVA